MTDVQIPIVGPTYTNRSLPVGSQLTRNYYIEVNQSNEPISLQPWPGLKSWSSAGTDANRGWGRLDNVLYTVSGNELYKVSSAGITTLIGTIPGIGRCQLQEDNAGNLVIVNGVGKPYTYDGTTLTQGTDTDLPNASTVAYLNSLVVYDSDTGTSFSDLNTPLVVNSANVLAANTKPDDMLAVVTHRQQIFAFGSESIEPIYFVGSGTPQYARVNNAVQNVGTSAVHSISTNNNFIYFLDNLRQPARMSGLSIQTIGNPAIGNAIRKYADVSDCYTKCISFDNQNFVLFSFPTANETWLFGEESGQWTNLSYGVDGDQYLLSDYIFIYDKHLVADRRNGNIYEMDFETFTDNGDVIQRKRQTASIDSRLAGIPKGRAMTMSSLTLEIEKGVSLVSGEATLIMEYSDDGGHTWSSERWQTIGEQGDYTRVIEWFGLGTFKTRVFRFTMTDSVNWVLINLKANVEVGLG